MHYLYFLLLSLLMVSCQASQPSEMDLYKSNQIQAHQELEAQFNQTIAQHIKVLNDAPLSTKAFVVSPQATTALKTTLKTLESQSSTKEKSTLTPSTKEEELKQLDSISNTQKTTALSAKDKTNNGAILLNVRDYQDTYNKIHQLATKYEFNIASEVEQMTDFHKRNTMEIYTTPNNFEILIKEFRDLAVVIRKKQVWQQEENTNFLQMQSKIASTKEQLDDLNKQLAALSNLEDQLQIKDKISEVTERLDLAVLTAKNALSNQAHSAILVSFYQTLDIAKPKAETFSADFSTNLTIGWSNFKQFVLDAALVWPYIIIGFILLMTVLLAIGSSRKKARQFKLQMLHGQNLQQQITQQNITKN